jgi:hypothetical protein
MSPMAEFGIAEGVVTPTVNVRTYTGSSGLYKVSYIEIEEMRDYGNGAEPYVYASTDFNPSINSSVVSLSNNLNPDQADTPYAYRNTWDFAVPGMSGTGYTVPEANAEITVTVHYFYGGDVVRGKHIGIYGTNAETKYTIAYINSLVRILHTSMVVLVRAWNQSWFSIRRLPLLLSPRKRLMTLSVPLIVRALSCPILRNLERYCIGYRRTDLTLRL